MSMSKVVLKKINKQTLTNCQSVITYLKGVSSMSDLVKVPRTSQTDSYISILLLLSDKGLNW